MADFELRVSPDVMMRQADAIQNRITAIKQQFGIIDSTVKKTRGYWEGEASRLHEKKFLKLKSDCDEITKRLGEHPNDLLKMAGLYKETESQSVGDANSLQSDIFS